jgi:glucose-1-phosphate thymidylyltransferase
VQCIILCAGFATRLRPLTLDCPKHLLPIAGRPMLDHLLDRLAESGIRSGWLVTNRRFFDNFNRWHSAGSHAVAIELLDDGTETNETRLGSIGDLNFALERGNIRDDFVVVNGDNLFTFSLQPVFEAFSRRGNIIALYDVGSKEVARLMGNAKCDESGRVISFVEKPSDPPTTLASIGIYVYRPQVRDLVNRYLSQGGSPDRTGDFVAWLYKQTAVFGHPIPAEAGVWFDIGSFDQYEEANRAFGGGPIDRESLGRCDD